MVEESTDKTAEAISAAHIMVRKKTTTPDTQKMKKPPLI